MFNLYVLTNDAIDNMYHGAFSDLLHGLEKYKDLACDFGIQIKLLKNQTTKQLTGEKIDGVISCWDSAISHYDEGFNKRTFKVASFVDDVHWWTKEQLVGKLEFFNKIDVVFSPYHRTLLTYDVYKEIQYKFASLFWWAIDYSFTLNTLWKDRKDIVLSSGTTGPWYKLRTSIILSKHPLVEHLKHCGYDNFVHPYYGNAYLQYMSTFKGGIGTSANPMPTAYDSTIIHPLDYTLKKPFEVVGSGALGFLEPTKDFEELGFVPYVHYVPITEDDFNKWDYILNPEAEKIANAGREFVKNNHSTKNRVLTILSTLKERWL